MNKSDMNSTSSSSWEAKPRANSQTHWDRLDALSDDEVDTSDIPPLRDEDFARGVWRLPSPASQSLPPAASPIVVEVAIDAETLAWFQSQGRDYETRMQAALRLYAEAHQSSV